MDPIGWVIIQEGEKLLVVLQVVPFLIIGEDIL